MLVTIATKENREGKIVGLNVKGKMKHTHCVNKVIREIVVYLVLSTTAERLLWKRNSKKLTYLLISTPPRF